MKRIMTGLILLLSTLPALAVEVPTPAEAKKVLDFYYHGQGQGLVLVENLICREISKEGDNKNECVDTLDNNTVPKDEQVNFWMAFLVPTKEEKLNILIQFEQAGVTRMVKNITISGSIRYRTWRKISFNKAGEWTVKIFNDNGDDTVLLGSTKVTVVEAAAQQPPQ